MVIMFFLNLLPLLILFFLLLPVLFLSPPFPLLPHSPFSSPLALFSFPSPLLFSPLPFPLSSFSSSSYLLTFL